MSAIECGRRYYEKNRNRINDRRRERYSKAQRHARYVRERRMGDDVGIEVFEALKLFARQPRLR